MVRILPTLLAAAAIICSANATTLNANKGCIIDKTTNSKACAGKETIGISKSGQVDILACIDSAAQNKYWCRLKTNVPTNWEQAYWGANNCLYSAGRNPILIGCAYSEQGTTPFNVY